MARSISELLLKMDVFGFLEAEDFPVVEEYMFTYQYEEGAYVFKEGAHGAYMFFIVEGIAEVSKIQDTKKLTIAQLTPGRSVGEMSMLDGRPRSATVKALSTLVLIVLKRQDFFNLMEQHPKTANRVILGIAGLLSESLRNTTSDLTEKTLSIC